MKILSDLAEKVITFVYICARQHTHVYLLDLL